jgi:hypothetical protein
MDDRQIWRIARQVPYESLCMFPRTDFRFDYEPRTSSYLIQFTAEGPGSFVLLPSIDRLIWELEVMRKEVLKKAGDDA